MIVDCSPRQTPEHETQEVWWHGAHWTPRAPIRYSYNKNNEQLDCNQNTSNTQWASSFLWLKHKWHCMRRCVRTFCFIHIRFTGPIFSYQCREQTRWRLIFRDSACYMNPGNEMHRILTLSLETGAPILWLLGLTNQNSLPYFQLHPYASAQYTGYLGKGVSKVHNMQLTVCLNSFMPFNILMADM